MKQIKQSKCKCIFMSCSTCPKLAYPDMSCRECLLWEHLRCECCSYSEKCEVLKNNYGGKINEST